MTGSIGKGKAGLYKLFGPEELVARHSANDKPCRLLDERFSMQPGGTEANLSFFEICLQVMSSNIAKR